MANLNNFMFKVKDYNKNKSNNIVNSNITFNEYADKWLKEYRLQIRKLDLPIVINNINIGKYYFGQKRLKRYYFFGLSTIFDELLFREKEIFCRTGEFNYSKFIKIGIK